jgi:hypothetical protein
LKFERRTLPKVTPALAQRVWAGQQRPSARRVARAMQHAGYRVHFTTVNRWRAQGWRTTAADHQLEIARGRLEAAAPLVTGDPETTVHDLIDNPTHSDFDELTDAEVLRRAAREVAIATAIIARAIKDRITTSDFDLVELTPTLFALGQSMHALPGAFEQAMDLIEAEQRNKALQI